MDAAPQCGATRGFWWSTHRVLRMESAGIHQCCFVCAAGGSSLTFLTPDEALYKNIYSFSNISNEHISSNTQENPATITAKKQAKDRFIERPESNMAPRSR